jgi:hypothetical protein
MSVLPTSGVALPFLDDGDATPEGRARGFIIASVPAQVPAKGVRTGRDGGYRLGLPVQSYRFSSMAEKK